MSDEFIPTADDLQSAFEAAAYVDENEEVEGMTTETAAEPVADQAHAGNQVAQATNQQGEVAAPDANEPFWKKRWFKIAILALVVGGGIMLYRRRCVKVRRDFDEEDD